MLALKLVVGNIADCGVCGYKDAGKHKELRNKIEWFNEYYSKGLKTKCFSQKKEVIRTRPNAYRFVGKGWKVLWLN